MHFLTHSFPTLDSAVLACSAGVSSTAANVSDLKRSVALAPEAAAVAFTVSGVAVILLSLNSWVRVRSVCHDGHHNSTQATAAHCSNTKTCSPTTRTYGVSITP